MIKIENTEIVGWEAAIRGMRNPLNSWEKSDSGYGCGNDKEYFCDKCSSSFHCPSREKTYNIGPNDLDLMKRLRNAGTDHRKFMRMITVYVDITAPLYWWKEFDTYKIGTVANSCSTMHKIHAKEFTLEDFSCEHLFDTPESEFNDSMDVLKEVIDILNLYRDHFVKNPHRKDYWWQLIQLLPSSYNQRRTVMLNYEVLANIYKSRRNHKLDEWHVFCEWIENLPYSELIIGEKVESEPTSKKN